MPGWGVGDLLKDLELDLLTRGRIVQLNHVSDHELMQLYKSARFCVFPSLYEGWGLPVGEALAMGKAVLSSDRGSLPEVGGDLVRYLPAWDVSAWANAILEWCTTPTKVQEVEQRVRSEYQVRTWRRTASVVKEVVDQILVNDSNVCMVLYPGYDCATETGIHVGSSLKGTGQEGGGYLMYGPHRAIAEGRYTVQIFGTVDETDDVELLFDISYDQGRQSLAQKVVQIVGAPGHEEDKLIVELNVDVEKNLSDFEVRCKGQATLIQLTRIHIIER